MTFLEKIAEAFKGTSPVDPAKFNDPIALKASWEPLKKGGSNFCTHKLVQVGSNRIEFRPSRGLQFFATFMVLMFIFVPFVSQVDFKNLSGEILSSSKTMVIVGSVVFVLFGMMVIGKLLFKAAIFDKNYGYFWKGRQKTDTVINPAEIKNAIALSQIHALQTISERVHGNKHNYTSYELNLVLKSGERVNVVDHGGKEALLKDAETLAQFLGISLWNAVS